MTTPPSPAIDVERAVKMLNELAAKFEQETQVFLGFKNVGRAEELRTLAVALASQPARIAELETQNRNLRSALENAHEKLVLAARSERDTGEAPTLHSTPWRTADFTALSPPASEP